MGDNLKGWSFNIKNSYLRNQNRFSTNNNVQKVLCKVRRVLNILNFFFKETTVSYYFFKKSVNVSVLRGKHL